MDKNTGGWRGILQERIQKLIKDISIEPKVMQKQICLCLNSTTPQKHIFTALYDQKLKTILTRNDQKVKVLLNNDRCAFVGNHFMSFT